MDNVLGAALATKGEYAARGIQGVGLKHLSADHFLVKQGFAQANSAFWILVAVHHSAEVNRYDVKVVLHSAKLATAKPMCTKGPVGVVVGCLFGGIEAANGARIIADSRDVGPIGPIARRIVIK